MVRPLLDDILSGMATLSIRVCARTRDSMAEDGGEEEKAGRGKEATLIIIKQVTNG